MEKIVKFAQGWVEAEDRTVSDGVLQASQGFDFQGCDGRLRQPLTFSQLDKLSREAELAAHLITASSESHGTVLVSDPLIKPVASPTFMMTQWIMLAQS